MAKRRKNQKDPRAEAPVEHMSSKHMASEPSSQPMANRPLVGALIIALALIIVFALFGQGGQPAAEEPVEETPVVEEPVIEVEPGTSPEAAPEPEPEPEPDEPEAELLSGLRCAGDNVEGTITNVLDSKLLVEDIRVLFNGNVVDPITLRCDKTILEPGESTLCTSIQGVLPTEGKNEIAVVIGEESIQATIEC